MQGREESGAVQLIQDRIVNAQVAVDLRAGVHDTVSDCIDPG
jgi:hypothetical protein